MKRLYLVRHGKAKKGWRGLNDMDRPLNRRGCEDAYQMIQFLKKSIPVPDLLVTSPSVRTFSTALIFAKTLGYPESQLLLRKEIYEAEAEDLKKLVENFKPPLDSVMLFGHNPGLSDFLQKICNLEIEDLPTTGVACIEWRSKGWKKICQKKGKIVFTQFPKNFSGLV